MQLIKVQRQEAIFSMKEVETSGQFIFSWRSSFRNPDPTIVSKYTLRVFHSFLLSLGHCSTLLCKKRSWQPPTIEWLTNTTEVRNYTKQAKKIYNSTDTAWWRTVGAKKRTFPDFICRNIDFGACLNFLGWSMNSIKLLRLYCRW